MAMAIKHLALKPPPATKSTKLGLLKLFAPQVPNLLVKSAGHFLSLTPQSGYWDLRTTLTVEFLRLWLGQPKQNTTVEDAQGITTKQAKVQANTWKVDVDVEVSPEDEKMLEELARRAIVVMGSANIEKHIPRVGVPSATGEWIGCRAKVMGEKEEHEEREGWSEGKKYQAMMEEMEGGEDGSVVLLLHGGMFRSCSRGGFCFFILFFIRFVLFSPFFYYYLYPYLYLYLYYYIYITPITPRSIANIFPFFNSRGILVI